MLRCLIFLNELSFAFKPDTNRANMIFNLVSVVRALRDVRKIRRDLIVASKEPISKVALGDGTHSVATLLTANEHKEYWRFIRALEQASPGTEAWDFDEPNHLQDVTFEGQQTFAMLWSYRTGSVIASIPSSNEWKEDNLVADLLELEGSEQTKDSKISLRNISASVHVDVHGPFLEQFGRSESASSLIFQDENFVARIYFFDHNPPHIHICLPNIPRETVATYSIRNDDVLEGELKGGLKRLVKRWVTDNRAQLMETWQRSRLGLKARI